MFVQLKNYRYLVTMQDVHPGVRPLPRTTSSSSTPKPTGGGTSRRSGSSARARPFTSSKSAPRTKQILEKLDEPLPMWFAAETPLDDVLKYIKTGDHHPDLTRASTSTSIPSASRRRKGLNRPSRSTSRASRSRPPFA